MSTRRLWALGGAVVIVGVLALGWFLLVQPMLKTSALNDDSRLAVEAQNTALEAQIQRTSEIDTAALREEIAELSLRVPAALDEQLVAERIRIAATALGATVTGIQFGQPQVLLGPDASAADPAVPAGDPAAEASTSPVSSEDLAVAALAQLVVVPLSITLEGELGAIAETAETLQDGERLFLVASVSFQADPAGLHPTGTIEASLFVLPESPTQ